MTHLLTFFHSLRTKRTWLTVWHFPWNLSSTQTMNQIIFWCAVRIEMIAWSFPLKFFLAQNRHALSQSTFMTGTKPNAPMIFFHKCSSYALSYISTGFIFLSRNAVATYFLYSDTVLTFSHAICTLLVKAQWIL